MIGAGCPALINVAVLREGAITQEQTVTKISSLGLSRSTRPCSASSRSRGESPAMTMARQPARRVAPSAAASVPWPETSPIRTAIVPSSRSTASKKSPPNSSRCSPGENATSTRRSSAWMAGGGTSARRSSRCSRALPSPARRASSMACRERRRCSSATEPAIHVSPIQRTANGMPSANGSGGSAYATSTM